MPPENNRQSADRDLARAVMQCGRDDSFMQAILDVYEELDRKARADETLCLGGGACCRFDLFDHRLYATIGELALLARSAPADRSRVNRNRCPYQQGPRCLARRNRPLGCRVFFCRETPGSSDTEAYETPHRRICGLHAEHDVPYAYVELISTLKIIHDFCR